MIKKLLIFLLCLLPLGLSAQLATGTWKVYGAFGQPNKVLETPHFVYLLTQGSLHSYDKDNDESRTYMPGDDLSDHQIKDIFYNEQGRYLTVCYINGNIDLLYDDGRRVNLPDIRDANLTVSKVINDVKFDGDLIYVATSFGIVVFRESTADVRESGVYGVNISMIGLTPTHLLIYPTEGERNHHLLSIEKTARLHSIVNYTSEGVLPDIFIEMTQVVSCSRVGDAAYYISDGKIHEVGFPWYDKVVSAIPEPLDGNLLVTASDISSVWAAGNGGQTTTDTDIIPLTAKEG